MDTGIPAKVTIDFKHKMIDSYKILEIVGKVCFIEEVPFRGCNCTDAAGREFAYKEVIKMLGEDHDTYDIIAITFNASQKNPKTEEFGMKFLKLLISIMLMSRQTPAIR